MNKVKEERKNKRSARPTLAPFFPPEELDPPRSLSFLRLTLYLLSI